MYSQRILLDLVERFGLSREQAYSIVQENAMACWKGRKSFYELLTGDERIRSRISSEELAELFEPEYYLRWADEIFSRFSLDLDTK